MASSSSLRRFLAAASVALLAACGADKPPADKPAAAAAPNNVNSLEIVDLQPGSGAAIAAGKQAVVQYTGWLYESSATDHKGKEFDSSLHSGQPFRFVIGAGQVIKGWDQGVLGMQVGGRRRLIVPPDLGYGESGAGGVIPPGATLVFDVELEGIE